MILSTLLTPSITPQTLLMIWMALPFLAGFYIYLLSKSALAGANRSLSPSWPGIVVKGVSVGDRLFALAVTLVSLIYGLSRLLSPETLDLQLLDQFGVSLLIDSLSGYLIVTNALVTAAVILYSWAKGKGAFFYTQVTILLGSVNAVFICADFISLYVALEVISVAAFLLMAHPRTDRSIWVGLRYLLVSNTAMLFYLMGAVLVYQHNQSFAFEGLGNAPTEAIALIFLGLLTKGGIFVSGLWLPLTHAESDTPVSALLSGAVITTGVFPLVRCALLVESVLPTLTVFSTATAIFGVVYAIRESDTKRMLAASTISQLGFVLANPPVAGMYALTHGLAKASLFLIAGNLPSRKFRELRQKPIPTALWLALALASLSISGFPLLAGFEAKTMTLKTLSGWQGITMNIASVGTAIAFAKFIFLPHSSTPKSSTSKSNNGLWLAIALLLIALLALNTLYSQAYSFTAVTKALITIATGWLLYRLGANALHRSTAPPIPGSPAPALPINPSLTLLMKKAEHMDHLIGAMSLVLTLLFWMVLA
ncbi:MAG: cation:proton antiporter [Cyanobacteria bacterium P01_F01_bin.150]